MNIPTLPDRYFKNRWGTYTQGWNACRKFALYLRKKETKKVEALLNEIKKIVREGVVEDIPEQKTTKKKKKIKFVFPITYELR